MARLAFQEFFEQPLSVIIFSIIECAERISKNLFSRAHFLFSTAPPRRVLATLAPALWPYQAHASPAAKTAGDCASQHGGRIRNRSRCSRVKPV
jgi:hypothetical protein